MVEARCAALTGTLRQWVMLRLGRLVKGRRAGAVRAAIEFLPQHSGTCYAGVNGTCGCGGWGDCVPARYHEETNGQAPAQHWPVDS